VYFYLLFLKKIYIYLFFFFKLKKKKKNEFQIFFGVCVSCSFSPFVTSGH